MTEPKTPPLDAGPSPDIEITDVSLNTPERSITAIVPGQSPANAAAAIRRDQVLTTVEPSRPRYICAPEDVKTRENLALAKLRGDKSVPKGLISRCQEILRAYTKDPEADFNQPHLIEAQIQEMERDYIKPIHKEIATSEWLIEHAKRGAAQASERNEAIAPFFSRILNQEPAILRNIEALRIQVRHMEAELATLREKTVPSTGSSVMLLSKESASADRLPPIRRDPPEAADPMVRNLANLMWKPGNRLVLRGAAVTGGTLWTLEIPGRYRIDDTRTPITIPLCVDIVITSGWHLASHALAGHELIVEGPDTPVRTVRTPAPHRFDHTSQAVVAPNPEDPPGLAVVAPHKLDLSVSATAAHKKAVQQLNDAVATDDFALALSNGRRARPTPLDRQALQTVADDLAAHGRAQLDSARWDHLYVPVDGPIALADGLAYLGPPAGRSRKVKAGRTLPAASSPFDQRTGMARPPNNPVSGLYCGGLLAGGLDWDRKEGPRWHCTGARFDYALPGSNGELILYPELDTDELSRQEGVDVLQTMKSIVSSMGVLTLDVMTVCLAVTAFVHSRGARSVVITPQDILEYKAIRRQGRDLAELEQRVVQAMETLRVLKFNASHLRYMDRKGKYKFVTFRGASLLIITKYTETEGDLSSGQHYEYTRAWTVMLGPWVDYFVTKKGTLWVSYFALETLLLDHRASRPGDCLAKAILYRLLTFPGSTNHINGPCKLSVADLLQDIGELPVPGARDRNWGSRTREALEAATATLEEVGLVASVEWLDEIGPEDVTRTKGWVDRWLAARIRITGLEARKNMQAAHEKRLSAPPTKSKPAAPPPQPKAGNCPETDVRHRTVTDVNAPAIWRKLDALYWPQSRLAKYLGRSPTYLSYVMNGRRKASLDMAQRLRDFLATSDEKLRGD
jgi:hypothetical protein